MSHLLVSGGLSICGSSRLCCLLTGGPCWVGPPTETTESFHLLVQSMGLWSLAICSGYWSVEPAHLWRLLICRFSHLWSLLLWETWYFWPPTHAFRRYISLCSADDPFVEPGHLSRPLVCGVQLPVECGARPSVDLVRNRSVQPRRLGTGSYLHLPAWWSCSSDESARVGRSTVCRDYL